MRVVATIAPAAGLADVPSVAVTQGDGRYGGLVERMDLDGDGAVIRGELIARRTARTEWRIANRFEMHDANGDGRVEQAGFIDSASARFAELDADGDGVLANGELRALRRRGHGRAGMQHGDPGG